MFVAWIVISKPNMSNIETFIIKTTASMIDHNKILHSDKTTKQPSWMAQICPKQIQDGGRPPSWKIKKNCNFSTAERPILTKFGMVMQLGPPDLNSQ